MEVKLADEESWYHPYQPLREGDWIQSLFNELIRACVTCLCLHVLCEDLYMSCVCGVLYVVCSEFSMCYAWDFVWVMCGFLFVLCAVLCAVYSHEPRRFAPSMPRFAR